MAPEKLQSLPALDHGALNVIDRFIVTPLDAKSRKPLEPAIQFDKPLMMTEFFVVYNKLQGKSFHKLAIQGRERAQELMEQGIARTQGGHGRASAVHHR